MPRKYWKQKNRYCWNTNLSEAVFLAILKLYCRAYSCSDTARTIRRYCLRHGFKPVSRQTVNRYYLLFGDYLYALLPDAYKFADVELDEDEAPDGGARTYPPGYDTQLILMAYHQALYGKLHYRDSINKLLIGNTTQDVYDLLRILSRSRCGIPLRTINAHLAYCMWLCLIPAIRPDENPTAALFQYLRETMEDHPIGTFELISIRLLKDPL